MSEISPYEPNISLDEEYIDIFANSSKWCNGDIIRVTHHKTVTNFCTCLDFDTVFTAKSEKFIFTKNFDKSASGMLCRSEIHHISQTMLKEKIPQKMRKDKSVIICCSDIVVIPYALFFCFHGQNPLSYYFIVL